MQQPESVLVVPMSPEPLIDLWDSDPDVGSGFDLH